MRILPVTATCLNCGVPMTPGFAGTLPNDPSRIRFPCAGCGYTNRIGSLFSILISLIVYLPAAFVLTGLVKGGYLRDNWWTIAALFAAFVVYSRLVFMAFFRLKSVPFH